jgi:hypothetical protein
MIRPESMQADAKKKTGKGQGELQKTVPLMHGVPFSGSKRKALNGCPFQLSGRYLLPLAGVLSAFKS